MKCPNIYNVMAKRLTKKSRLNGFVSMHDVNYILGAVFRIKREERLDILKDLKRYGLVSEFNPKGLWIK